MLALFSQLSLVPSSLSKVRRITYTRLLHLRRMSQSLTLRANKMGGLRKSSNFWLSPWLKILHPQSPQQSLPNLILEVLLQSSSHLCRAWVFQTRTACRISLPPSTWEMCIAQVKCQSLIRKPQRLSKQWQQTLHSLRENWLLISILSSLGVSKYTFPMLSLMSSRNFIWSTF